MGLVGARGEKREREKEDDARRIEVVIACWTASCLFLDCCPLVLPDPPMELAALDLVRDALVLSLTLSAPILAVGLLVGLVISILQAVTQIQDQTLTFVPKIAAMLIVAVALLGWLSVRLMEFAVAMFASAA